MLNDVERRNLDLIRIAEAAKHEFIQPGDMRYWRDRQITPKKLGKHSGDVNGGSSPPRRAQGCAHSGADSR